MLKPFVTALLSAAILCFSTWPLYRLVERWLGGRRTLAAFAMTLLMILVLVLPLALIAGTYVDDVPRLLDGLRGMLAEGLPGPPAWVTTLPLAGEWLDAGWREIVGSKEQLAEALKRIAVPARAAVVQAGIVAGEGVLQFSLIAFIGFFFYRDGSMLARALRNGLERIAGNSSGRLLEIVGGTINGVMYGIVGTGLAQGLAAVIGLLIAGVPGAVMLGFLTALLSIVPAGPPLIWIGATVWLVFQDQIGWAVFMALWGFFIVSGIDNVVKPLADQPRREPAFRAGAARRVRRDTRIRLRRHLPRSDAARARLQVRAPLGGAGDRDHGGLKKERAQLPRRASQMPASTIAPPAICTAPMPSPRIAQA